MNGVYSELVERHGPADSHRLVVEAVPSGSRVLDVGCATGYLAEALSERGSVTVGVEPDPKAAAMAREHCENVVEGGIDDPAVRARLAGDFDVVLFADVLEHVPDPWETLRFAHELVRRDGRVVVSIPNIAHWTARRALMAGRFPYADHGLFDRTHLRFFTRESALALARDCGFDVTEERFTTIELPLESRLRRLTRRPPDAPPGLVAATLRRRAAQRWPGLCAFQFVLTLRPRPGAG